MTQQLNRPNYVSAQVTFVDCNLLILCKNAQRAELLHCYSQLTPPNLVQTQHGGLLIMNCYVLWSIVMLVKWETFEQGWKNLGFLVNVFRF